VFIVFEGGEGSGKSTQARALHRRLLRLKIATTLTQDPGGTAIGGRIERWLKEASDIPVQAELLLFTAARALLTEEVIMPALEAGIVVICDRYGPSTIAYQGYGRMLDLDTVSAVNRLASGGLQPDIAFLLDIPPEEGLARKKSWAADRFQQEPLDFHRRVREGYLKAATDDPHHWLVLDGSLPRRLLESLVWDRVKGHLKANAAI
jgi:dTMP kinase